MRHIIKCDCCGDCVVGWVDLADDKTFDQAGYGVVCNDCCGKESTKVKLAKEAHERKEVIELRKKLGL